MAGIRTAIGTLRATAAGAGTVGVVTACVCDVWPERVTQAVAAPGRPGGGGAPEARQPGTPTPARRSSTVSTSSDLATCLLPQSKGSPHVSPRDYEGWLWRDESTDRAPATKRQDHRQPGCRQRDATHVHEGWARRERGAAEPSLRGSRRNDRPDSAGRTAGSARGAGRTACADRSPAPAGEPHLRGPAGPTCGAGPTGAACGRRRGGRSRREHISHRGHAGHGTATTVRGAIALVDGHRERRIGARHGATRGRLSGIGAPTVRRTVALCDSRVGGAAKGGARLRAAAAAGRSDALIHRDAGLGRSRRDVVR